MVQAALANKRTSSGTPPPQRASLASIGTPRQDCLSSTGTSNEDGRNEPKGATLDNIPAQSPSPPPATTLSNASSGITEGMEQPQRKRDAGKSASSDEDTDEDMPDEVLSDSTGSEWLPDTAVSRLSDTSDSLTWQKCCSEGCGMVCKDAVQEEVHAGHCPAPSSMMGICVLLPNSCSGDGDCAAEEKCCQEGCNKVCKHAIQTIVG